MIDRKEFAEELMLRENVRKAIRHVLGKRKSKRLNEEQELRSVIRKLLEGQSAVATVAKHESTGINTLEDLLKNSNLLSVLETGYKSLTTDKQQRDSYRAHILNAVEKSLAPEESRKEAGSDAELEPVEEEIDINISDRPEDDPDFIDVSDEKEEPVAEPDEREEFGIEGEDKTGRNRAYDDFQNVEKNILVAYDNLDNPKDIQMFEEYLLKNLALYFDKFEGELSTTPEEPQAAQDAQPDAPTPAPEEGEPETDIPDFELEEGMEINLESLIDKLLEQQNMTNPNIEKGFSRNKSLSNTLRQEGKSSEAFEIMLSALTLEEVIGLKLECSMKLTNGKLYGFNLWSKIVDISKEALYNAVISVTDTNAEIRRILGVNPSSWVDIKRKFDTDRE